MPKIDLKSVPERRGSGYPAPFHEIAEGRVRRRLGDAGGLTQFGVNLLQLPPGAASSQRHWHSGEDEFVYVVSGEMILVTDKGEERLRAGDCAAFPKGVADGHQLVNKSDAVAVCLEVGTRSEDDVCTYSDIDMMIDSKVGRYVHRDGTPYPERE
ncbi:MAG TPA: cupin domain-containing protein [Rhizomicrobium sp.]|nr:cupin domain-containing protein [Rhizomicrobium sp.]